MVLTDETVEQLRGVFGDDVFQEAALVALERQLPLPVPYLVFIAKLLRQFGYHDGEPGYHHRKRWHREQAVGLLPQLFGWRSAADPARLIDARLALCEIPDWLWRLHVDEGFVCHHRCSHPMSRWFPARLGGKRTVRCKDCLAGHARKTYWRKREAVA